MALLRTEVRGEAWNRMVRAGAEVLMRAEGGAWECAAPAALEAYFWLLFSSLYSPFSN